MGADYYEVGRQTARLAERVINGEKPKDIPIQDYVPETMRINQSLVEEYGIKLPQDIVEKADIVKNSWRS